MRLPCPFCGARDLSEFTCLGSVAGPRPDPNVEGAPEAFYEWAYLRDNPAGPHREYWYHGQGCRAWLVIERDTRTHDILGAVLAAEANR